MSIDNDKDLVAYDIVVDANKLRHSNIQKKSLKENITSILRKINDELVIAHREGNYSIKTTMPIVFDIPNMSNKVGQRIIWYHVIRHLIDKNFRVDIHPSKDFCKLQITWITREDEQMISQQTKVIAEHTKRF
jgi:hypothetical protein